MPAKDSTGKDLQIGQKVNVKGHANNVFEIE